MNCGRQRVFYDEAGWWKEEISNGNILKDVEKGVGGESNLPDSKLNRGEVQKKWCEFALAIYPTERWNWDSGPEVTSRNHRGLRKEELRVALKNAELKKPWRHHWQLGDEESGRVAERGSSELSVVEITWIHQESTLVSRVWGSGN